ncbi:Sterol O-acyltransferase [Purpureocillium takamizusanense]|uniref:Sterol O-acyltransferase n=1 Tax=Purpureocillium takamizusanense TaxID=2060973 RepID=A0A9Q8V880_9HYPO|nr:Sterol O-acyltransferase [Purpureocillium takamizusanense]UNI15604.1 Sterol O-acyltransferase [Purpureocillium takamizusanense]
MAIQDGATADEDRPLKAPPSIASRVNANGNAPPSDGQPHSLADALHAAGVHLDGASVTGSDTPSEEDYDENVRPSYASGASIATNARPLTRRRKPNADKSQPSPPKNERLANVIRDESGVLIIPDNDHGIQELLRQSPLRFKDPKAAKKLSKFGNLTYTQQLSVFDPHNVVATNSPFHGFYTLFWLSVALFVFKISANNWRQYGTPLGSQEILRIMFSRDVIVLLLSDGIMCGLTGVSWAIQKLVFRGWLDWDGWGWIIQNIWQTTFLAGVVGWTLIRDWPWTHTVYFVLHGLAMLMKQHSYAFYNGHLSTAYKKRRYLLAKLKQLDGIHPSPDESSTAPAASTIDTSRLDAPPSAAERRHSLAQLPNAERDIDRISAAIASRQPLDDEQIRLFERVVKWEVDALADELRGTARDASKAYPNNLGFLSHYKWIPLPTVVYELEYPQTHSIDWAYVAEKTVALVGVIFVMVQVAQYAIYPVWLKTVQMKEDGLSLADQFKEFPWLYGDLVFPLMMEYLLAWYLIWETVLNILAELTFFADRSFYGPWWNCVSWDQFARLWNQPVHLFLLRHVYHSSISSMKVNKHTATLITFFLSACVHELVMLCLFKKLRGYLLALQMFQLPLVRLGRTKWLRGRQTLGNVLFWLGVFTGPSLLCSLYFIL